MKILERSLEDSIKIFVKNWHYLFKNLTGLHQDLYQFSNQDFSQDLDILTGSVTWVVLDIALSYK